MLSFFVGVPAVAWRCVALTFMCVNGALFDCREYARGLPLDDGPEIFGMHPNANISFQAQETYNILKTCLSIQPRTAGSKEGEKSPDEIAQVATDILSAVVVPQKVHSQSVSYRQLLSLWNAGQALAADIYSKLPEPLLMSEAGRTTFQIKGEHMDSLATVLGQEMARFNKLLSVMSRSLVDLQRAIRGEILLSDELDKCVALVVAVIDGKRRAVGRGAR